MKTSISQWGNSLAIRIPMAFARQLGIKKEDKIELNLEKEQIILTKPKYNLNDLLAQITSDNLHEETDTGAPIGKEQW